MPSQDRSQRVHLPWRAVALVLAGDWRCGTQDGAMRAVNTPPYFGGKFRVVDFALSNCINSGIRRVGVISRKKSHSLQRHLQRGSEFLGGAAPEAVELLPVAPPVDVGRGYLGTADAVLQNGAVLEGCNAEYVLVIGGDHIYKMNYAVMLADHVAKGRDCTVACIDVPPDEACAVDLMVVGEQWQIVDRVARAAHAPDAASSPGRAMASMGIFIFNASYLAAELARDRDDPHSGHDIANDIVPRAVRAGNASAHPFPMSCVGAVRGAEPYWRDVSTFDSYWDANIDLTATAPRLDLYDAHWPIWTYQPPLPPTKFLHNQPDRRGTAVESLVSGGCVISGSVLRSVLFSAVRVHSYASVEWSVLLPGVEVGRHVRLNRAIVERDCTIPDGLVIGEDASVDAERFVRTDGGITLVTADRLARLRGATTA